MSQYIAQEIRRWSGIRLDRERADLELDELAYAMNADLFIEPGVIRLRRGTSALTSTAVGTIRRVHRANSCRYQVSGTALYRDTTIVNSTLDADSVAMAPYRPLNDTSTWLFVANQSAMLKDNGTNCRNWGITAPAAAPSVSNTGSGSLSAGVYGVKYTYVRKVGTAVVAESNPSDAGTDTSAGSDLLEVGVTASSDPQVTHIRVYRTAAGGTSYLYDQEATNATATLNSSQADSALGAAVDTDNDTPPAAGFVSDQYAERLWICQVESYPHYLYYTKRFQPEAVPAANYLEISNPEDPIQCAHPFGGILLVLTKGRKYRVIGSGTAGFVAQECPSKRGVVSPYAACSGEDGVYFIARDGVFKSNGFSPDEQLASPILPLFKGVARNGYSAINWDAENTFCIAQFERQLYVAVATGTASQPNVVFVNRIGTDRWQAYDWTPRSLHVEDDTKYLVMGAQNGYVYQLETGASDNGSSIALVVDSKDYGHTTPDSPSGSLTRKVYAFTKEDLDGDTVTVAFYVDGTSKHSYSSSSARVPSPVALPYDAQGYRWRKRWSYTGSTVVRIYGTTVMASPMVGA